MHRLLRRTLCGLLLAGCSRAPAPPAVPPAPVARGSALAATPGRPSASTTSQLERIRPPPAPCPASQRSPETLIAGAAGAFEREAYAVALTCAEQALHLAPRSVAALHYRAASLAALDRTDEARRVYARALAIDPDDPEALAGAADLYVSHLGGDRESLEVGLEYALRGVRHASRAGAGQKELAGRLYLLAGMAENDLGRSSEALAHLDEALAAQPDDVDALYERGVALYELCRFVDARRSFERMLVVSPDDAWAIHYLALVAERLGEGERARELFGRAARIAPGDFKSPLEMDRARFDEEVRRAVASLPDGERRALRSVPVEIVDLPSLDDLVAVEPPLSPSILGLYRGPPEKEPCSAADGSRCRSIVVFRKNLIRFAKNEQELSEQVRVTLLHELGHLHGETDDDLRERGLE